MSDLENYYIGIIEKIENLVSDSQIDKAIFILEDELSAPYIPLNFQNILEEKLTNLTADKKYFSHIKKYENFSKEELLNSIVEKDALNIFAMENFFNRYRNNFSKSDLSFFENIMLSKTLKNEYKTLIVENLIYAEIKGTINFYNANFSKEHKIDLENLTIITASNLYNNILSIISDLALKEPSVFEMAKTILLLIFHYFFPTEPNFDYKDLAKGIFDYILFSLQGIDFKNNEINDLILKITSHIF